MIGPKLRLLATLACAALLASACGMDRQDASLTLEEARLAVDAAERWGGENFAPKPMSDARRELTTAEVHFASRRYAQVAAPARRAIDAARLARALSDKPHASTSKPRRKRRSP